MPAALEIGTGSSAPSFSFSSSTIRSAVFLPTPGIAWKRAVSWSTIARRRSAAGEPETIASATFGPDPGDREQVDEELPLSRVGEAVELQRVLAHVQVGLDDDLAGALGGAHRRRRGGEEVADAVDVEHEAVRRPAGRASPQPRDHPAIRSSGGASAWQIATASASAAWFGVGFDSSARIVRTIRCTCAFSARP